MTQNGVWAAPPPQIPFRLHQSSEPKSLNPQTIKAASNQFLIQNLHRNLLKYSDQEGLQPDLAESCARSKDRRTLTCKIKKDLKWSDGTLLTAQDFLKSYQELLAPTNKRPRPDLLFGIKGAKEIYEVGHGSLGVHLKNRDTLRFVLTEDDPDFEYVLSLPQTSPWSENRYSGPYKLSKWTKGSKIQLEPNLNYPNGNPKRPTVEVLFIEDEGIALKLFEKNELDFLRRLPTLHIPRYKQTKEFHWIPLARLDYLGFGESLKNMPLLRKALAESLNYEELKKIFHSDGLPGCPGLPPAWLESGKPPCFQFQIKEAQDAFSKIPPKKRKTLSFIYSAAGGEDHRRGAEWEQDQWRKNLGISVKIRAIENKLFLSELANSSPDIFRRGVTSDFPTCRSFLKQFSSNSSENLLKIENPEFHSALKHLLESKKEPDQKKWCEESLRQLVRTYEFIPLGQIHFALLSKKKFTKWSLDSMGYLDLAHLEFKE